MRNTIGYIFIVLSALLVFRLIYNYKAVFETIASVLAIVLGESHLQDKSSMLIYFLGITMEVVLAILLIFFGIRKLTTRS